MNASIKETGNQTDKETVRKHSAKDDQREQPVRRDGSLTVRHCPKCGSMRVHRSRRRGWIEDVLNFVGATVCRCHDCRTRRAWFGFITLPLSKGIPTEPQWPSLALFTSAFIACVLVVWWMITHLSGLSG